MKNLRISKRQLRNYCPAKADWLLSMNNAPNNSRWCSVSDEWYRTIAAYITARNLSSVDWSNRFGALAIIEPMKNMGWRWRSSQLRRDWQWRINDDADFMQIHPAPRWNSPATKHRLLCWNFCICCAGKSAGGYVLLMKLWKQWQERQIFNNQRKP